MKPQNQQNGAHSTEPLSQVKFHNLFNLPIFKAFVRDRLDVLSKFLFSLQDSNPACPDQKIGDNAPNNNKF